MGLTQLLFDQSLQTYRKLRSEPGVQVALMSRAPLLISTGRLDDAEADLHAALDMGRREQYAPAHPRMIRPLVLLAEVLMAKGDAAEAERLLRDALDSLRRGRGSEHYETAVAMSRLAAVLLEQASPDGEVEAETLAREGLASLDAILPERHREAWRRFDAMSVLGGALLEKGKGRLPVDATSAAALFIEAEPLLLRGHEDMHPVATMAARKREALDRIVRLYEAWDAAQPGQGYAEKAAEWRLKLTASPRARAPR